MVDREVAEREVVIRPAQPPAQHATFRASDQPLLQDAQSIVVAVAALARQRMEGAFLHEQSASVQSETFEPNFPGSNDVFQSPARTTIRPSPTAAFASFTTAAMTRSRFFAL